MAEADDGTAAPAEVPSHDATGEAGGSRVEDAAPDTTAAPEGQFATKKAAALMASLFPADVVALAVVPGPEEANGRQVVLPASDELLDRTRLAGAMAGVGGPLHALVGRTMMSRIDVEAGRGVAAALAAGSDDVVVRLEALLAAGFFVCASRALGAVGRVTDNAVAAGDTRGVLDLARSSGALARSFRGACVAVEAARGRVRQRTSIPDFVVRRIPAKAKTGAGGGP
ncbi:MAG: hypothetical protein JXB32_25995 [Deltaproteobacteria bacterium]|nr:hypothetical protein [Deltaproteobacteria bacterium]